MKKSKFILILLVALTLLLPFSAVSAAPAQQNGTYVVQPGDYLWKIARQFNTTPDVIIQLNGLTSSLITVGQVLKVPNGGSAPAPANPNPAPAAGTGNGVYTVQPGDSLWRIATNHNMTVADLMAMNGLTSSIITVGQQLKVKGGSAPAPAPAGAPAGGTCTGGSGTYVVQSGDSLWAIARKNNMTVNDLMAMNGLTSALIHVGDSLKVSGAGNCSGNAAAPAPTAAAPAASTAPVVNAANLSGFSLGGQVQGFGGDAVGAMQRAGMTYVKRQIKWTPGLNPGDGINQINDAHAKGFKVLLSVAGYPDGSLASNFDEYAGYVGQLAGGGADAIEIWNEMNLDREWKPGEIGPASYLPMLQKAYNAIKSRNPNTLVILGAMAPTGFFGGCAQNSAGCDDLPYLQGLVSMGALNYTDCVGIHYNEGILPPAATSGDPRGAGGFYSRYYQGMVNTYWTAINGAKKLCFTELGYLSGQEWGYVPPAFLWTGQYNLTVAQHAQYLAEAAALSINQGRVALMIVFNVDIKTWTDDPQAGFAILRPDGSCPACDTLGAVMRR